jgi:transposase
MPRVYRVELNDEQREELRRRKRDPKTKPRTRNRLEMIRLSDASRTIPQIAQVVEESEQRVRYWVKRFLEEGTFDALEDRPHPGKISSLTPDLLRAVRTEIEKGERTWTSAQLAEWLEREHGVRLTPNHLAELLHRAKIVWKRTSRSLKHKQKPPDVEAKRADLQTLEKGGRRLDRSVPPGRSGVLYDPADDLQLVSGGGAVVRPV